MLTVKEIKPNVYEVTLKGVLEKPDVETMERELTPALKGKGPIGLIVRAEEWRDLTAEALAEDMKFEFGLLTQWSKIAKMALVTDLQAFAAIARWIDPILPMIDIRCFASSDAAEAEAFASDLPQQVDEGGGKGATLLADGSDGVIAFEVNGRITAEDVDRVMQPLQPILERDGKVNLLVKFVSWDGFDPSLMTDTSVMGAKFGAIGNVGRYAVVGAPSWMKGMMSGVAPMMPFEMRFFEAADESDARQWVGWT